MLTHAHTSSWQMPHLQQDILEEVLSYFGPENWVVNGTVDERRPAQAALASCATVSHAVSECALNVLWSKVYNILFLLKLLPISKRGYVIVSCTRRHALSSTNTMC